MISKLILLAFLVGISQATFHTINTENLKKVFNSAKPYVDLNSAYYSIRGLKLLKENIENPAVSKYIVDCLIIEIK